MKTSLTKEESAKLIELGVDPHLAGDKKFFDIHPEVLKGNAEYAAPWGWFHIFDLSTLLSIIPKVIDDAHFDISHDGEEWNVCYETTNSRGDLVPYMDSLHYASELIDALYELLVWCVKNNCYPNP